MPFGRLNTYETKQYAQASGESTPQQQLPAQFRSTLQPSSPIQSRQDLHGDWMDDLHRAPIVSRRPRGIGMRYLYARGMVRQPVERLGNDVRPVPNISQFQNKLQGPIHDAGFNDALFQAGYPGFNLGLSFKVPSINTMGGPRLNLQSPITISQRRTTNPVRRPSGAVPLA